MTAWDAIVLGLLQGATEFLPVSSSGHLVIGQALLGLELPGVAFEIAVHIATLVSVVVAFRKRLLLLTRKLFAFDSDAIRYMALIVVATIPAVVVGLFFKDLLLGLFESPVVTGIGLLLTGTLLWSARVPLRRAVTSESSEDDLSLFRLGVLGALLIGLGQALAIVPGISRSGTTVVIALWLGIDGREAAAFSFLMAIPAILGAAWFQVSELGGAAAIETGPLLIGAAVAAITGIAAIRIFVETLQRRAFHLFSPYCWAVGALFLFYLAMR